MKKNFAIFALLFIAIAGMVHGAATFNTPTASGTMTGAYNINVSGSMVNMTNCSISGSSGAASDTFSLWLYNVTGGTAWMNGTLYTTNEIDASDWVLSGTCYNLSGSSESVTSISAVIIDNTVPVCNVLGVSNGDEVAPDATWTVTGTNATSATIEFGNNGANTMTESSNGDSFTFSGHIPEGIYTVKVITTDGTNSTTLELQDIDIDAGSTAKQVGVALSTDSESKKQASSGNFMLFAGVGIGIYFLLKKK
jgi:hypothetical protein